MPLTGRSSEVSAVSFTGHQYLRASYLASLLLGVLFSMGCAPRQQAEIVERVVLTQRQQDERIGGQMIRFAQPGDTLYSIAFVTGLDVNNIAAWNGIQDTSKLSVGQRIRLTQPIGFRAVQRPKHPLASGKAVATKKVVTRHTPVASKKTATVQSNRKQTKSVVSTETVSPETRAPSKKNAKGHPIQSHSSASSQSRVQGRATSKAVSGLSQQVLSWQWPLRGTLVKRFDLNQGQQGIYIQGQRGQSVKASAAGEVVYAGNSLKGYGNLLIIKHSSEFLSAYAHNQSIAVQEGQQVQSGQVIAKLGTDLKGQAVSQFQIRKNGNPVDPMKYLR